MNESKDMTSEDYSVIAFYGVSSTEPSMSSFYKIVIDWFNELGYPPDKISVHGVGHSGKPILFSRTDSRIRKNGFKDINSFTIFATHPEGKTPVNDYYLMASYDGNPENEYCFIAACSSIANLSSNTMLPLAKKLISAVNFEYGIGYTRKHHLGPAMYAIGIGQGLGSGGSDYEEGLNITQWGNIGMTHKIYCEGYIREIYPWNFLTDKQLQLSVGNVKFIEWIQEQPVRGSLELISSDITLWKVEDNNIHAIRQCLQSTGNIFNWRSYQSRA